MLADRPVCYGHGVRTTIESRGVGFVFERSLEQLRRGDVIFGNLEAVLMEMDPRPSLFEGEMKGRPDFARGLADIGFSVLSVANNHALQFGREGFDETVAAVRDAGIEPVGLADEDGRSNVVSFARGATRVVLASYSLRPEKYTPQSSAYARTTDPDTLVRHVRELRDRGHVILSLHWGEEFMHFPSPDQRALARTLIDAGAALIVGHHPHVLQGVEEYGGGVVVYSLGNFVSDAWQRPIRETAILQCTFGPSGLDSWHLEPVVVNTEHQPVALEGGTASRLMGQIARYSEPLDASPPPTSEALDEAQAEYEAAAARAYTRNRLQAYGYFVRHLHRYSFDVIADSLRRFARRRVDPTHP